MKTNTHKTSDSQPGSVPASPVKAQALKLGIDVHADRYVVVRQMDGNTPQPAQTFPPAALLAWVKTQFALAERKVVSKVNNKGVSKGVSPSY